MDTKKKLIGITLATAAAISFVSAPFMSTTAFAASKVKCYGVNACKGKSACKTAANACKGKNSCKGKGFKMMTEKKCTKAGGSTTEPST